jgi:hypothetical protein
MNTIVVKLLREAWMAITGMYLIALPGAEKKEIRTNIIKRKRALNRTFALQQLSYLQSLDIARSRYMDKWLRINTTPQEELWNN